MDLIFYLLLLVLLYSGFSTLYFLTFSLASIIGQGKANFSTRYGFRKKFNTGYYQYNMLQQNLWQYKKIAVLIPAYKEDSVIIDTVKAAIKMDYPGSLYDVIIIADYLRLTTLERLKSLPVKLIQVTLQKSTKVNALNYAMDKIDENYDLVLVLDADNEMAPDTLKKLSKRMNGKKDVIQCHRVAKNIDTPMAILDAISEEINNNIFSLGQRNLGFSSRLAGSGMCFNYKHFRNLIKHIDAVGGFDKELEHKLLADKVRINYANDILIYDEKVRQSGVFARQRTRWIASQFHYLKRFYVPAFKALIREGNFDYFNKAFQMALPPRLLFPPFLVLMLFVSLLIGEWILIEGYSVALILFVTANFLSIPGKFLNCRFLAAIAELPYALFKLTKSLITIKGKNKIFIHTPHSN